MLDLLLKLRDVLGMLHLNHLQPRLTLLRRLPRLQHQLLHLVLILRFQFEQFLIFFD